MTMAALVLFLGVSAGFLVWQQMAQLQVAAPISEPQVLEVSQGTPFIHIVRAMEDRGWVERGEWLRLYTRFNPELGALQAGYYEFKPGMSPVDMLTMMAAGKSKRWPIRFLEGWTFAQMRQELARHEQLQQTLPGLSNEEVMQALGMDEDMHPEGWFFPDTYNYRAGQSDMSILRQAFNTMNRTLANEWEARMEGLPYETPYEALIMASIVERETGAPHERGEVAGVFVRRLDKGMRLQTDPTVIYGMGERYQGRITRSDLQEHTPWNTYRISGLPPTPIAMPGQGAIHAALNPEDGDTFYFVARGDGTHQFSRTLAEHNRAVREFQLQRRSDYRSSPAPVTGPDPQSSEEEVAEEEPTAPISDDREAQDND
ncbi:MAG: endolytic transglycosylase MltG [Halomonadaceae bacterium]|nr:MAG: endolytic transglycosylase MltG [Halomonadaceae bacterium]